MGPSPHKGGSTDLSGPRHMLLIVFTKAWHVDTMKRQQDFVCFNDIRCADAVACGCLRMLCTKAANLMQGLNAQENSKKIQVSPVAAKGVLLISRPKLWHGINLACSVANEAITLHLSNCARPHHADNRLELLKRQPLLGVVALELDGRPNSL